jgi:hypothetical protein
MNDLNGEVEDLKRGREGLAKLLESVRADNIVIDSRAKNTEMIKLGQSISSTQRSPLRPRSVLKKEKRKSSQPSTDQLPEENIIL